ncbi:alcohol dehydrogenase-like regulatory protein ErcA [Chitinivibrio alkaliphilus]|uniref:Iron-containing alcohol dehydrogenase n=1 Tax=Chitinivibrio alkaliphilus ACht1 TaxID=1313304 RepID=U7D7X7_9BACT|nr:alcohol dehydrogenase-like regulatory protein ErcA [Chitinivibrio alkaliphilus]ERP39055.1 iron-containing alcohol dehydrogenase [Chitinivibrio alkaliphilus ACht1]
MSIQQELRKFVAPECIFGKNSRLLVTQYALNYGGTRTLLVSDPGVCNAGWCQEIQDLLEQAGMEVVLFDSISANPRDMEVMAGAHVYTDHHCDLIVAVGGGSVLDCAKGIGIIVSNGGSIIEYAGVDQVPIPMPPLICIPTTGGTSADVSQFAIINDISENVKIAIISKTVVPDVALIDPTTLQTMPPYLAACTGIDALVHAIEAYVSNASSPITDVHALHAIQLITSSLAHFVNDVAQTAHQYTVMLASFQAGLAFSNASLGSVHAMAHSLGGFLDLPHGECNAILVPHVISYNFATVPEKCIRIGDAMGLSLEGLSQEESRKKIISSIESLQVACGIKGGLSARGVTLDDIPRLAEKAMLDPCNATNPRPPTRGDLETLYREAL